MHGKYPLVSGAVNTSQLELVRLAPAMRAVKKIEKRVFCQVMTKIIRVVVFSQYDVITTCPDQTGIQLI
jgi:hypothetical protein